MICGFRSVLCVSLFEGSLLFDRNYVCEKRSKVSVQSVRPLDQAGSMGS